jgi:8-oxo-dGTP pyrophosphatase MutT (NUDIX family)
MERQFTASVYIFHEGRTLLIKHRKLGKWLQPGGHIEPNETPVEAAKREALEETGLEIAILTEENIWIEEANANSFERPYLCLIEEIPPYKSSPYHQHIDFIYVARALNCDDPKPHEGQEMRWFSEEEIIHLPSEDLFIESRKTLLKLFSQITVLYELRF